MGSIKDRNGMDLTEAEEIKKRWQEYWSGFPFPSPVTFRLKLFSVLLNFSLLMTIDPKDTTRPKNGKRKDLLLAESKNTKDLSQSSVSLNSKIREVVS